MEKSYKGLRKVVTHSLLKKFFVRVHLVVKMFYFDYFVRWTGYRSSHGSWVDSLVDL